MFTQTRLRITNGSSGRVIKDWSDIWPLTRIKEVQLDQRHFFVKQICGFDVDIAYPTETEAVEISYRPSWLAWLLAGAALVLVCGVGPCFFN